ncbi:MAG: hypothetical protein LBH93_08270 [Chitinispirillales bacterium]|nr:hypothetical protein [Chitinispirillales bacterium]
MTVISNIRAALAEHLKNIELEVHGLTNRIANDKRDITRLESDVAQFGTRKQAKIEERGKCLSGIEGLEGSRAQMSIELESAREKRAALESARDAVREDYNGRLTEIETSRKEVKGISGELKQSRDEQERRRIRERMWESYELDMESLEQDGLAVLEEDDEAVTREIAMYKERIKHVNMAALEDFDTESARAVHNHHRSGSKEFLGDAHNPLRGRRSEHHAPRRRRPARGRDTHQRAPRRQKNARRAAPLRRRARAHRDIASLRALPCQALRLLHPRRA